MKYLVICVFAACTTFGLVQSNEEPVKPVEAVKQPDRPFRCPVCTIKGKDAQLQSCDNNIKDEICRGEDPVCVLAQYFSGFPYQFRRHCYSRKSYNRAKTYCDGTKCVLAMCDTSGCKADLELDKEQPDGPFSCPVCKVAVNPGKDADTACDENIRNEICPGEDPVCVLFKSFSGSQVEFIDRRCHSSEGYNRVKGYCDKPGKNCAMAMCDNSGCKAELITTNAGIEEN